MKIKVIKKNLINTQKTSIVEAEVTEKDLQRKMVSNVSDWIDEFQERRAEETDRAFRQL